MTHVFSEDHISTTYTNQQQIHATSEAYKQNQEIQSIRAKCRQFIRDWRQNEIFIYRQKAKAHYRQNQFNLEIDFTDIVAFDKDLSDRLIHSPNEIIPILESSVLEIIAETLLPKPEISKMHSFQILLKNFNRIEAIRNLRAKHISKLICVPGIVISAYKVQSKATQLEIRCSTCNDTRRLVCSRGFAMTPIPRVCSSNREGNDPNRCELDPFVVVPDNCDFIDTQKFRLQELPEDVPTGEMPLHILLAADRDLVNRVTPGTRLNVIGIFSIFQNKVKSSNDKNKSVNIRFPYIQVIGFEPIDTAFESLKYTFTPSEEEEMRALSRDPEIYEKLAQSLAPKIFGHLDVKKAIICLLFGGTRKQLSSGTRLRGDINVLLLGDPSVAKSQLLKCTEKSAPISVYTSGKGTSAAGLTASVIRDAQGDFHLEGGAMVLADGGCVCIDEFDKMREDDRVAIHEAMEQQTISIAKAGITTILNSRAAVLAAANPTFGRFDDMKKATENIDFETTILSRFDLIFVIKDKRDPEKDALLSSHVINIHMQKEIDMNQPEIDPNLFTKYIAYCRRNCRPRLSEDASELLRNRYVAFRLDAKKREDEQGNSAIPITVRQLEAIIRIAEARAKMSLSDVATVEHVQESIRLFQVATMAAASHEHISDQNMDHLYNIQDSDFVKNVQRAERHLKRRLAIGTKWRFMRVIRELVARDHSENAVRKAIHNMRCRGEIEMLAQGKALIRKR